MPTVPRFTLQAALAQQQGRCFYCNRPLVMTIPGRTKQPRNAATADHLTPAALGGTEALWNIVAACSPCNYAKGGRRPTALELERKAALGVDSLRLPV